MLDLRLGLALTLLAGSAVATPVPPVSLTIAPASAQYGNQVEVIVFQATLKLDASASGPATVCTTAYGSFQFTKVTKDGARLKPMRTGALSIEPLGWSQTQSLATLRPGQAVDVPFRLMRNSDYSVILRELHPSKKIGFDPALLYTLTVPGRYSFAVTYGYTGPDGGHADIFRHAIRSNRVTLTLVP